LEDFKRQTFLKALARVCADLKDWSGRWVHYSDVNKLGVNPRQFHQDPAGIYFFPEEFKPEGSLWTKKKFVFTVEIKPTANILDLGALSQKEKIDLAAKLGVEVTDEDFKGKYFDNRSWWELIKNKYILVTTAPGAAKWSKDFRALGYDAVFDDAKTIFLNEVQLIVFNPKVIDVLDVTERSGKGGIFKKVQDHQKLLAKYLEPWGTVEIKPAKKKKAQYGDPAYIAGKVSFTKDDAYIDWQVSISNEQLMTLAVLSASKKPSNYSLGSLVKNYNEKEIQRAAESAVKYVLEI
jgi:hypothetical protein